MSVSFCGEGLDCKQKYLSTVGGGMKVIIWNNKEINKQITCKVMTKHCPVISPSLPCTPLSVCVTVITLSTVLSCPPFAVSFISHTFLQVAKLFWKQFLLRIVWTYMNLFSAAYPPAFRHLFLCSHRNTTMPSLGILWLLFFFTGTFSWKEEHTQPSPLPVSPSVKAPFHPSN